MTTSKPRKLSSRMSPTIWLNYWAIWKESEFLDVLLFLIENTTSLKYFFYWIIVNFYELPLSQGQIDHIFLVLTSTKTVVNDCTLRDQYSDVIDRFWHSLVN